MSDAMSEIKLACPAAAARTALSSQEWIRFYTQEEHDNGSKPQGGQNEECPFGAGRKSV